MSTIQNNKLIAEFMDFKPISRDVYMFPDIKIEGGETISNNRHVSDIHYHKSWDWLMPVVEKIENIEDEENSDEVYGFHLYDVEIRQNVCYIHGADIEESSSDKLTNVYFAVLHFIKEIYNKNTVNE